MNAYVHALSAERDALRSFLDDAEASFMEFGIAPDVSQPTELPPATARDHAQTRPADTSGAWLPYLTSEALNQTCPRGAAVHYTGVAGMAVTARVLRETTSTPGITLQTHTYTGAPRTYTVYRYDEHADEFASVARGEYS